METVPCANISIFINDEIVCADTDGFFGMLSPKDQPRLEVEINYSDYCGIELFNVYLNQQTKERETRYINGEKLLSGNQCFVRSITIQESPLNVPYPAKKDANFCILLCTSSGFSVYEVSIISQGGRFFLTSQEIYSGNCYDFEGFIFAPTLLNKNRQRLDILEIISDLSAKNKITFPKIDENKAIQAMDQLYKDEYEKLSVSDLNENQARVIFWSHSNLWGIAAVTEALTPKRVARIHWSQLLPRTKNGLRYLNPSEVVQFSATRKAHQGIFSTTIDVELLSVSLE